MLFLLFGSSGAGKTFALHARASWLREHAAVLSSRTDVIRQEATMGEMRWSRWSGLRAGAHSLAGAAAYDQRDE